MAFEIYERKIIRHKIKKKVLIPDLYAFIECYISNWVLNFPIETFERVFPFLAMKRNETCFNKVDKDTKS